MVFTEISKSGIVFMGKRGKICLVFNMFSVQVEYAGVLDLFSRLCMGETDPNTPRLGETYKQHRVI